MADAPGASLYVPFRLQPGESKTIRLYMAWYVPFSLVREGLEPIDDVDVPIVPVVNERGEPAGYIDTSIQLSDKYRPWYSSRFANIEEVADYWMKNYNTLKEKQSCLLMHFMLQLCLLKLLKLLLLILLY